MGFEPGKIIHHFQVRSLMRSELLFDQYHAVDLQTTEEVSLQVFLPGRSSSYAFIEDMRVQAEALMRLEHPNLVPVIDSGECEDGFYITSRLVEGKLLSEYENLPMGAKQAAVLLAQVAAALDYLHQQKLVHGMLSLDQVLVAEGDHVYVLNPGLAQSLQREIARKVPETLVGVGIGDPYTLAPEQILGRSILPQSDQYALGAVFYILLTGRKPYESGSPVETAIQKMARPLSWPQALPKSIPYGAIELVHKSLSRQPKERFKNTHEMLRSFERLARGKPIAFHLSREQRQGAPRRSFTALRIGLLLTIFAGILGLVYYARFQNPAVRAVQQPTLLVSAAIAQVTLEDAVSPSAGFASATPQPKTEVSSEETSQVIETNTPSPALETPQPASQEGPRLIFTPITRKMNLLDSGAVLDQTEEIYRLGLGKWMQIAWSGETTFAAASSAGVFIISDGGLKRFIDTKGWANSVQFSIDRSLLAVGMKNGDIQLWDWNTGQQVGLLQGHTGTVTRILFSPNRRQVISASQDLNIKIWDTNSGQLLQNIPAHQQPVNDIALTSDGRELVSGADDGLVKVWDIATGRKLFEVSNGIAVTAVAVTPDGAWVAAGGDGWIQQWSLTTRQLRSDPIFTTEGVLSLYYDDESTEGKSLLIQNFKGEVKRTDAQYFQTLSGRSRFSILDDKEISAFSARNAAIWRGAQEIDSSRVSLKLEDFMHLTWDERTMNILYENFDELYFSPDSAYVLAGGQRGLAYLWNSPMNFVLKLSYEQIPPGNPFSQDSQKFVLLGEKQIKPSKRGSSAVNVTTLKVLDAATGTLVIELLDVPLRSLVRFVNQDTLLVASNGMQAKVWDLNSGLEAKAASANEYGCLVTRSRTDNQVLGVYTAFGILTEWNDATRYLCSLGTRFSSGPAAISLDNTRVAYFNANNLLEVLDLEGQKIIWNNLPARKVTSLSFSPDVALLAVGYQDGGLEIWDAQTGKVIQSLSGHFAALNKLLFSPDSRMIASGSLDGTMRIWGILSDEP